MYISLKDLFQNDDMQGEFILRDKKMDEANKEKIMKHMREEQAEEDELTNYVKDKIKVLNTPDRSNE